MEAKEIGDIVQASIQAKIIEAFKSTPEMIDALVKACLSQEVNEHGGKPDYSSRSKMPYLEYLARDTVQQIAKTAVLEYFATMEPVIKNQVKAKLQSSEVSDALTRCLIDSVKNDYSLKVTLTPQED